MRLTRSRWPRTSARRPRRPRGRHEQGFTLLELVVTMGLLLLVGGVLLSSLESVQRSETFVRGRAAALDDLRFTMNRMTKEIRQGSTVVGTPGAGSLSIQTYVQGAPVTVTYQVSGAALTRQVGSATPVTLQDNLVSPAVFSYEPVADSPEVVTVTLSVEPSNLPETTVTVESEIRLRNLGA